MNVAVIKAVVALRTAGHTATLPISREGEHVEVGEVGSAAGAAVVGIVIAQAGPLRHLAEESGVYVKVVGLVLCIGAAVIRVIAQHEHHVRRAAAGPLVVGTACRLLIVGASPAVTHHPDAGIGGRAWHR